MDHPKEAHSRTKQADTSVTLLIDSQPVSILKDNLAPFCFHTKPVKSSLAPGDALQGPWMGWISCINPKKRWDWTLLKYQVRLFEGGNREYLFSSHGPLQMQGEWNVYKK
jgi:hypothetical protein